MAEPHHVTIVMVEDDPGHASLIEKNLRRAGLANPIVKIENGRVALEYFTSTGSFEGQQQPNAMLVLLDLNLPEVDGFQILEALKKDERMRAIPIIILTTTDNPREVERAYELGCNVYITKPVEYDQFAESIRKLGLMLSVVKVPNGE